MAKDGSNNLRQNVNASQFGLRDPRRFGFSGIAPGKEVADMHPVGFKESRVIPLSRPIMATQDYIDPAKVDRMKTRGRNRPWLVEDDNGRLMAWDGHHRLAKALSAGQKTMKVDVSRPIA